MKNTLLTFFLLISSTSLLRADAITFEATVNSPRISLDEVLQLTLTFTGINNDLDPVSLPVLDGFTAKYLGPSTSVSIVNGDYHSERSFLYNLFPNKIGHFQIPPISATVSGQTYTTKPIDVEVFQDSTQAQAANQPADQSQTPTLDSLKDKIRIMVSVGKTNAYLNEQIPVSIKLFVNEVPVRDIQFPQFDKTGFLVDDFDKPDQGSEVVNGVKYDTVEFKTYIYPNRLGDVPFGPVQIQANILYKASQNNPFNQGNDLLGVNNIFNNFFDSYATRPITINFQAMLLHISPLPENNQPQNFSGAIGQFDFQASVSPLQVKAGDPLTLKMALQGNGNFKNIKMPEFKAPGFKIYDPSIKSSSNLKTAEQVIIPTSAGIKEVPAISFSYFDTSAKDYRTITQGPFAIQVTAPNPDQDFKAVGFVDVSKDSLNLQTNRFPAGKILNKVFSDLRKFSSLIWVRFALLIIFVGGISYYLWRRFQNRLKSDLAFARRYMAGREAREALKPADDFISTGKTKDFYALLSKVLKDYLANKWHQSSAALSNGEILNHLKTVKLDETQIGKIKVLLEESDMVCFAGAMRDASQMRQDLLQVQELITNLEKSLK